MFVRPEHALTLFGSPDGHRQPAHLEWAPVRSYRHGRSPGRRALSLWLDPVTPANADARGTDGRADGRLEHVQWPVDGRRDGCLGRGLLRRDGRDAQGHMYGERMDSVYNSGRLGLSVERLTEAQKVCTYHIPTVEKGRG